ncbi:MAG: HNH endonuclease [Dysgonamonadaceae bacterium]|jgi:hypothetical protein|nr:HNH endonuclease [Dysgonamonadaceae bacterium]
MDESWKDIPGYFGCYQVSNYGRIKSLKRRNRRGHIVHERILKPFYNGSYNSITISIDNVAKKIAIHRLVAIVFIPNPENKAEVNHINGIKTDNKKDNLEWVTRSENLIHRYRILKQKPSKGFSGRHGKLHHHSKPVVQLTLDGVFINEFESANQAEIYLGLSSGSVSGVCNKRRNAKSAKGYVFKWKDTAQIQSIGKTPDTKK